MSLDSILHPIWESAAPINLSIDPSKQAATESNGRFSLAVHASLWVLQWH
jgi:hypothetical protein